MKKWITTDKLEIGKRYFDSFILISIENDLFYPDRVTINYRDEYGCYRSYDSHRDSLWECNVFKFGR